MPFAFFLGRGAVTNLLIAGLSTTVPAILVDLSVLSELPRARARSHRYLWSDK